jgi:hypothetical protein
MLGKKTSFQNQGDPRRSPCLFICQFACNSQASILCTCSKSKSKSTSYNKKWNALHLNNTAPTGG